MKPRRIAIAVAPVGRQVPEGIVNPVTPDAVAEETIACWRAGASLVHLHVRDEHGEQTEDLSCFRRTLDLIRKESDIVLQVSTGGLSTLSLEQRCVGLNDPRVESASLNMGSVNFGETVYINTLPDIRYWAGRMKETGVVPEMEIFEGGMINNAKILVDEGVLGPPLNFGFALGFRGALPAEARNVAFLKSILPAGAHWGVMHDGMDDFTLHAAAIGLGASAVRCGFEDGVCSAPGKPVRRNVELVEHLAALIRQMGHEVAGCSQTRQVLGNAGS